MIILLTAILTIVVMLGFLAWLLESSNMDYPALGLIAYLIWPVSLIFLAIYLYCFEAMYDNYKKRKEEEEGKIQSKKDHERFADIFFPDRYKK